MKRRIASSVLAASLLVVLSVALAYAGSTARWNVTVPFAFTAGNVAFPSGDYTISETSLNSVLLIQNRQDNRTIYISTIAGRYSGQYGNARILFHRYADQYFLSQLFSGLGDDSRELSVSRLERDSMGTVQLAAHDSRQPEVIVIGTR